MLFLSVFCNENIADTKKLRLEDKNPKRFGKNINNDDVIICNQQSFIEIIYLTYKFLPSFFHVTKKGKVIYRNYMNIVLDSLLTRTEFNTKQAISLEEARNKYRGPIILFPEECKTNGKAVLSFLPFLNGISTITFKIHIITFKYTFKYFSPAHSARSLIRHLILLCYQVFIIYLA